MSERSPTRVSQIEEALRLMDDFLSARQLVELTGLTPQHVAACLCHLQRHLVIDAVRSHGELFWFLTGQDDRARVKKETTKGYSRAPGETRKSTKRRKLFVKPEAAGEK